MRVLEKIAFLDSGISPLLGGALGGAGGYALGKGVINPILESKRKSILDKMMRGEEIVKGIEKGKATAPIAAATIGAILLAAIAANRAKKQERERIENYLLMNQLREQDMQGFSRGEEVAYGAPSARY